MNALEEGPELKLDFAKLRSIGSANLDVIPVVLQDADSNRVLFIGYANEEALHETLRRREAVLWSTSRNELWHKGATSGDVLHLEGSASHCFTLKLYPAKRAEALAKWVGYFASG